MLQYAIVCYSILWITGVWKWRIVGGGEDRRYINIYSNTGRIPIYLSYHIQVPSTVPVNYTTGIILPETSPLRARRWCSLGPLRTRAGSIVHYTIHYTGVSIVRYAMQGQQRAEGGAGEEERRRDEGTGEGAKEVALAAGSKAAGARVIGG
jgi:hypothetical protein